MKLSIVAVGKPKLGFARAGLENYLKRLRRVADVDLVIVKGSDAAAEGEALLARSHGAFRIVLDERGLDFSSVEFARLIGERRDGGTRHFAVLIGGADGHTVETRAAADLVLALGRLTLQHELALVVVAEQLYRAHSILAGGPYHRE